MRWRLMESVNDKQAGDRWKHTKKVSLGKLRGYDTIGSGEVSIAVSDRGESMSEFLSRLDLGAAVDEDVKTDDARTLPLVIRAIDNVRDWIFKSACDDMSPEKIEPFGVQGPRSTAWHVRFLERQNMHTEGYGRYGRTRHRVTEAGIPRLRGPVAAVEGTGQSVWLSAF